MKKKPSPEMEDSRIVSILKKMEDKKLRNDLVWMKGDGVVSDITATSSGIISLDVALGIGGYPHGRIIEVYGENSSGKTTTTLHAIASFQKQGGVAVFVDAEHSLSLKYSEQLGVDVENLILNQPDCGEQALQIVEAMASELTKGDIIVVDSVAALVPRKELEGEMGDQHVGLQARMMSQALRKFTGIVAKSGVLIFFTNQTRTRIGQTYGDPTDTPSGKALKFYSSVRLHVKRKSRVKDSEEVIGNATEIEVVKNKCAPPYRTAETEIRYGEGVPKALDLLILGMNSGIVEKSGAWLSYKGERIGQGKENAYKLLRDNPEMLASIERDIREQFGVKG